MLGVALGISHVQSQLPDLVYALLSGLNASTVGLIALAAVQLSEVAVTDKMTRLLVGTTACLGLLYQGCLQGQIWR
jgi:chromate transport protein ChrA